VIDTSIFLAQQPRVKSFCLVGSSLYVEAPNDVDFLVLTSHTGFSEAHSEDFDNWQLCGGQYDDQTDKWGAVRKGAVNLIITTDSAWFSRCKLASDVCHALKLQDKGDRIVVHRVVRDGYSPEEANARRDGSR
jgi:hypothetical protein